MGQAAPGSGACSIWGGDGGKAGDPCLEGNYKGAVSTPPNLGSCPRIRFKLVSHALVDGKPDLPEPGEKMTSADITCKAGVLPALGSAEM